MWFVFGLMAGVDHPFYLCSCSPSIFVCLSCPSVCLFIHSLLPSPCSNATDTKIKGVSKRAFLLRKKVVRSEKRVSKEDDSDWKASQEK